MVFYRAVIFTSSDVLFEMFPMGASIAITNDKNHTMTNDNFWGVWLCTTTKRSLLMYEVLPTG